MTRTNGKASESVETVGIGVAKSFEASTGIVNSKDGTEGIRVEDSKDWPEGTLGKLIQ